MISRDENTNDSGKVKKLASLKEGLEKKIADTEAELEGLRIMLEFINETLLKKGFRRAEAKTAQPTTSVRPPFEDQEAVFPLTAASGSLLANLTVSQNSLRVVMAEGVTLNTKTPPFQQFLIERVLSKMQEKDQEAVERGELPPGEALSYGLTLDGDILREIEARNLTSERLRELKSSIHWTLEKMHEKAKKTA